MVDQISNSSARVPFDLPDKEGAFEMGTVERIVTQLVPPFSGETVIIEALPGQSYRFDFDASLARPLVVGDDFVLVFGRDGDGRPDASLVIENLLEVARSTAGGFLMPALIVDGLSVPADQLIQRVLALGSAEDTLETAAAPLLSGGRSSYDDDLGSLIDLLEPQGPLGDTVLVFDRPELSAFVPLENPQDNDVFVPFPGNGTDDGGSGIEVIAAADALIVDESHLDRDAMADFSDNFRLEGGAGARDLRYELLLPEGDGTASGVVETATGQAVLLYRTANGVVEGRAGPDDPVVFTLSVDDARGAVTLDQRRPLYHNDPTDPDDPLSLLADVIRLKVTATDRDGDTAQATLDPGPELVFRDDGPEAHDDVDSVKEGGPTVASGNVITGRDVHDGDANTTDGGADDAGADGFESLVWAGQRTVEGGQQLEGNYGTLRVGVDGRYRYELEGDNAAVQGLNGGQTLTETFGYSLTDGDGDSDTATLTITINGADDPVSITELTSALNGGAVSVDEDDLPEGSDPQKESLTQSGRFRLFTPDGLEDLTIGGATVIGNGVFTATTIAAPDGLGTLRITAFNAATGEASYSFTLANNADHPEGKGENDVFVTFSVVVTDRDGDSARDSLVVRIVDDVPGVTAHGLLAGLEVDESDLDRDATVNLADYFTIDGGADGLVSLDYELSLPGGDGRSSGLTDTLTDWDITLHKTEKGTLEGRAVGVQESYLVFTLSVDDARGAVTLDQRRPLYHNDPTDPDDPLSLLADVIRLKVTATDGDGDTAQATLDLRPELVFRDDGPEAHDDVDSVTEGGPTVASGNVITGEDIGSNRDLNLTDGVADDIGADGNSSVRWDNLSGDFIRGYSVQGNYGTLRVGVDGRYRYELEGDNAAVQGLNGGQTLTETFGYSLTDGDGDSDTATLTITINGAGGVGPGIEVIATADDLIVDESHLDRDATADFSDNFRLEGGDGAGDLRYGLSLPGGDGTASGVVETATGQAVLLYRTANGVVEGRAGGSSGPVAFTLSVDEASGAVTLDQLRAVVHANLFDPDDPISLLPDVIRLSATVEDESGRLDSTSLGLGRNVVFRDDGPLAVNDRDSVAERPGTRVPQNIGIVLDMSGSIGPEGFQQQISSLRAFGRDLFDAHREVTLSVVGFSSVAGVLGVFKSFSDLNRALDAIVKEGKTIRFEEPNGRFFRGGGETDFQEGFEELFRSPSSPDDGAGYRYNAGANNQIFFVSDGQRTEGLRLFRYLQIGSHNHDRIERGLIRITGVGFGDELDKGRFEAFFGKSLLDADDVIPISSFAELGDTLITNLTGGEDTASGNVLDNDAGGADGLDPLTWVGANNGVVAGGYGTLRVGADGRYRYELEGDNAAVQGLNDGQTLTETFRYSLDDGDLDSDSATLTITIGGANEAVVEGDRPESGQLYEATRSIARHGYASQSVRSFGRIVGNLRSYQERDVPFNVELEERSVPDGRYYKIDGQIWLEAGQSYQFRESSVSWARLTINTMTLIEDFLPDQEATGTYSPEQSGYYDFRFELVTLIDSGIQIVEGRYGLEYRTSADEDWQTLSARSAPGPVADDPLASGPALPAGAVLSDAPGDDQEPPGKEAPLAEADEEIVNLQPGSDEPSAQPEEQQRIVAFDEGEVLGLHDVLDGLECAEDREIDDDRAISPDDEGRLLVDGIGIGRLEADYGIQATRITPGGGLETAAITDVLDLEASDVSIKEFVLPF